MFCTGCQHFIDEWALSLESRSDGSGRLDYKLFERALHADVPGLRSSSEASCNICRNIWCCLSSHEQLNLPSSTQVVLAVAPDQGRPLLKASFVDSNGSSALSSRMIAMFLKEDLSEDIVEVIRHLSLNGDSTSTGSSASFQLSQYWLSDCLKNHERCPKPGSWLPTRVLDVSSADLRDDCVRLVETSTLHIDEQSRKYAVLSHCWGTERFLTTTDANYKDHLSKIAINDLPPSFQDAISIVRRMGQRFLWIDSLCIIQGSKADWDKESVQMCQVYAEAIYTITSAHSVSAFGGIFRPRDGVRTFPFEIQLTMSGFTKSLIFVPTPRREILWDRMDLAIDKRAWCFQEMILSTRNYIYEPDGIRYECLSTSRSERDPDGATLQTQSRISNVRLDIKNLPPDAEIFNRFGDDSPSRSSAWQDIVQDYTSRSLTKYTDKLIGVAGVAEAVQRCTKYQYLAGHWKELLFLDLCWYVHYDGEGTIGAAASIHITRKPPPYKEAESVAPTWSWASVNVPVTHDNATRGQSMCDVLSATIVGSPDRQSGELTIRGESRVMYVFNTVKGVLKTVEDLGAKHRYLDSHKTPRNIVRGVNTMVASETPSSFGSRTILPVRFMPDELIDPKTPITFLAICRRPSMRGMSLELRRQTIATLCLVPTTHGAYRRVGLAVWEDCSWFGYDCSEDRALKADAYRQMTRPWSRLKPPNLCLDSSHVHADEQTWSWPNPKYHSSAKMVEQTLRII